MKRGGGHPRLMQVQSCAVGVGKKEVVMDEKNQREVDVLIIGAGLAGLTLARHLLLEKPEIRILMLDRLAEIPS
ncbi:MAG: lycopene cyclase family protein, partial [Thermoanaerobaculia bacterium]